MKKQKSFAQLKKDLDRVFNAYIRQRDSYLYGGDLFVCISCGETKSRSQMNAGHFYSAGHHSALRWDENNVHGQCVACNLWLHGNLLGYREGLLKKIGHEGLMMLEIRKNNVSKIGRFEVELLIQKYKEKLK